MEVIYQSILSMEKGITRTEAFTYRFLQIIRNQAELSRDLRFMILWAQLWSSNQTLCILEISLSLNFQSIPTKNKTHKWHDSGVTTCVYRCLHMLSSVYTCLPVFYVLNHHNTCENTCDFFINKITRAYVALFSVRIFSLLLHSHH